VDGTPKTRGGEFGVGVFRDEPFLLTGFHDLHDFLESRNGGLAERGVFLCVRGHKATTVHGTEVVGFHQSEFCISPSHGVQLGHGVADAFGRTFFQSDVQAIKPFFCDRGEEGFFVGEMSVGGRFADPGFSGRFAERQRMGTLLPDDQEACFNKRLAEVAMVVGRSAFFDVAKGFFLGFRIFSVHKAIITKELDKSAV